MGDQVVEQRKPGFEQRQGMTWPFPEDWLSLAAAALTPVPPGKAAVPSSSATLHATVLVHVSVIFDSA